MEVWKPVVGYEGYYLVSDLGRVMSTMKGMRRQPGHIFTNSITRTGYMQVNLTKDNVKTIYKVHRLVATAFLHNPENRETVNHKDGNKQNNTVGNLEWATRSENVLHAYRTGLKHPNTGDKNGRATITELQAINIMHCKGSVTSKELSELTGVRRDTITSIWSGIHWGYLFKKQNQLIDLRGTK